jgi:hypothetical protein
MLEEPNQTLRLPLPPTQIPMELIAKLIRRPSTPSAGGVGLAIMVEEFHGVQLWAVAGRKCSPANSSVEVQL